MNPNSKILRSFRSLVFLSLMGTGSAISADDHHIVLTNTDDDYTKLRADIIQNGGVIVTEMPEIKMLVISSSPSVTNRIAASPHIAKMGRDRAHRIDPQEDTSDTPQLSVVSTTARSLRHDLSRQSGFDPAFNLSGLMWNFSRINVPNAWKITQGSPDVTVGIIDSGIDYTHPEFSARFNAGLLEVVDLSSPNGMSFCKEVTGLSDQDIANNKQVNADLDFAGHGTAMAGIIAADLDGLGSNGIAPKVKIVALKTAQWCGSDYDSSEIEAFYEAGKRGIDIVSISMGDILDLTDPGSQALYEGYARSVAFAKEKGTVIVASSGNNHLRIGEGGKIISHGNITTPGRNAADLYGLYEVPGGTLGVVDVAATVNVVEASVNNCTPDTHSPLGENTATCKPQSEAHQPAGVGSKDQLAYYSNYGPRIDIAAPGGSRKFNLPAHDGGGTRGWPWTDADGYKAWGVFTPNSNWIYAQNPNGPCFNSSGPDIVFPLGFLPDQCYSTTIGTSESAPHVAAVLALMVSANPELQHHPEALTEQLKKNAKHIHGNKTPPLSPTDTTPGDLSGIPCTGNPASTTKVAGYCHLGGQPISDREAYGVGLVNAGKRFK